MIRRGNKLRMEELRDLRWDFFISLTHCLSHRPSFPLSSVTVKSYSPLHLFRPFHLISWPVSVSFLFFLPSSLFTLFFFSLRYKNSFVIPQCLITVTRCSCLPVRSSNSLISFYHSLSNRPKCYPKLSKDFLSFSLLSLLLLAIFPFIALKLFPKGFSFSATSASSLRLQQRSAGTKNTHLW